MHFFRFTQSSKMVVGNGFIAFGNWIDFIAILTMAVHILKVNEYEMALISAAMLLPGIVLANKIGQLVSTKDCIKWLKLSLSIKVLLTLLLVLVDILPIFVLILVVRAIFNSIAIPILSVMSIKYVPQPEQTKYYAILTLINSVAKIVAPALGGVIGYIVGEQTTLFISGILTSFGLITFLAIPHALSVVTQPQLNNTQKTDVGLHQKTTGIWISAAGIIAVYFCAVFMVNNQLPLILKINQFNKSALGFLVSASAAGNFVRGLISIKNSKTHAFVGKISELYVPSIMTMSIFIAIAIYCATAQKMLIEPLILMFFVSGVFSAQFTIASNLFIVTHFSQQVGLMTSKLQAIQNMAMLVAPFLGALILSYFGPTVLFFLCGALGIFLLSILKFSSFNLFRPFT